VNGYNPSKKSEVFLEYDEQPRIARDGIVGCELRGDVLTLELEQRAADALGISDVRHIVAEFELAPTVPAELRTALAVIFVDRLTYQDRSQA
jgi:hypothetical protein